MTYFLTPGQSNAKTALSRGVESAILHLAPASLSGRNVCPMSSAGCRSACLNTSGRGTMSVVQSARVRKTKLLFENKKEFWKLLIADLSRLEKRANKKRIPAVARLNGTSDLPWERMRDPESEKTVFELFPEIQFYDYTAVPGRSDFPSNYHLTFSLKENNKQVAQDELRRGMNVAVVFDSEDYPPRFLGFPVINGSASDLRYLDPRGGHVVGLCAKGRAKLDRTGFVQWGFSSGNQVSS
jgi:hypothetical protein